MDNLVSVIVPCYNQAKYLPETLDSVLAQTYQSWECIIVNDGSPDDTEEVAKRYCDKDARFKYVYQDNGGVSLARNTGIKESVGEFIFPLDADDLIHPTYLEKAVNVFVQQKNTKLVYCNVEYFGKVKGRCDHGDYSFNNLVWYNMIPVTCLYRRSDFDKTIGYNSNMKYGYEDWDFFLSLLKSEDCVVRLEDTLFYYRIKSRSRSTQLGPYLEYTFRQIVKNHPDVYMNHIDDILLDKRLAGYYKSSLPYRLGLKLLSPYRKMKQLFCKRYYQDV